jgi:hypothetical protein
LPTFVDPIGLNGSSAAEPLVIAMAKVLSAQTNPTTLVYAKPGSCVGVTSVQEDATPTGRASRPTASPGRLLPGHAGEPCTGLPRRSRPRRRRAGPAYLWVVLRDSRGGVAFAGYTVAITP